MPRIESNGNQEKSDGLNGKIRADLLGNRVIVWDEEAARLLYSGFFGKPVGIKKPKGLVFSRPLELSLLESLYLLEKGKIEVVETAATDSQGQGQLDTEQFKTRCKQSFNNFLDLYTVYKHLRDLKYVVRPGLKFGCDFSVYKQGPGVDHATFLVQVVTSDSELEAIHLVRAGRLATSVKKRYVIATVLKKNSSEKHGDVKYYIFKWYKP